MTGRWTGALALAAVLAYGQMPTAQITGRVIDASGAVIPSTSVTVTNIDTGVSLAPRDVSQRLVVNFIYDLSFGEGKPLAGGASGILDGLIAGCTVAGAAMPQTGRPISTTATTNTNSYGGGSHPNNTGRSAELSAPERFIERWFNTSVFSQPDPFTFGNTGCMLRDVREPGIVNADFSEQKNFPLTERVKLQFRAEFFNLSNTPHFGRPGAVFGDPQFGIMCGRANLPRQIQFGLELL
jgi:hypothetical protein